MAIHLKEFDVDSFRGIKDLKISNMNHINIVAGDNNCGKTSILEALLLLRNPGEPSNLIRIARLRKKGPGGSGERTYQSFMNLFHHERAEEAFERRLGIKACFSDSELHCEVFGYEKLTMLDLEAMGDNPSIRYGKPEIPQECLEFQGKQICKYGGMLSKKEFTFNEFDMVSKFPISNQRLLNVVYLAPFDHLDRSIFSNIISSAAYKDLCIKVLQEFDPDIQDILLTRDKFSSWPIECVEHRELGIMPISTYGDGIKKVLSIANGLASARGGILLIDEIETALHAKYYESIFSFIMLASRKFEVQVFITTHSLEAIDSFLAIEEYDDQKEYDSLSVITLKKERNRSYSRVLSGRHVYENREKFGFEVRL